LIISIYLDILFHMTPVTLFKALSDETRLRLLNLSLHHELNVNEIVRVLGMGQSRVSHHLKILTDSGLLTHRRDGLWIFYSAVSDGPGSDFIRSVRYLFENDRHFHQDLDAAALLIAERSKRTTRFFDSVAGNWERLKKELLGDVDINRKILDALPERGTMVDLGCGTGDLLPVLKQKAGLVIGVERSAKMLEEARKNFVSEPDRVDIRVGELEHLPLRDNEADAAITNMVLHHLPDPRKALQEVRRILRKSGTFLIVDLIQHEDESMREAFGDHWLGFSPEVLERWLNEYGFSTTRIERFDLKTGLEGFILLSNKNSHEGD
jgi:ubiquinone/menaquinone biosynthesis C-methylase UbiE